MSADLPHSVVHTAKMLIQYDWPGLKKKWFNCDILREIKAIKSSCHLTSKKNIYTMYIIHLYFFVGRECMGETRQRSGEQNNIASDTMHQIEFSNCSRV